MILQSNPTEVCEFGAKIQRESAYCETKGEWIFGLENLSKILNNSDALVSYILNSMSKIVEATKQQQKWRTKRDVKLQLCSISKLYLYLSMFQTNYSF